MAFISPLRDNEPWFLALNAFTLYKNKSAMIKKNELKAVKKKREAEERL